MVHIKYYCHLGIINDRLFGSKQLTDSMDQKISMLIINFNLCRVSKTPKVDRVRWPSMPTVH